MCHMLPGAVYAHEGEAAIVDTKHKELKHVPTAKSWPYIQVDYFFMKYRDEEVAAAVFVRRRLEVQEVLGP